MSAMRGARPAPVSPVAWECHQTLKPDWEPVQTPDGKTYWWNTITDETSWEQPVINQRVLVKTPGGSTPGTGQRWSPGTQSFLNWKADDPRRSPAYQQLQRDRVSQAELDEFLRVAQLDKSQLPNVKAKFARFDANTREERAIRARANARLRQLAFQEQYRKLCEGLVQCITCACCSRLPPAPEVESPEKMFYADAKSACKSQNALSVEALKKYQTAREQQAASPNTPSPSKAAQSPYAGLPRSLESSF